MILNISLSTKFEGQYARWRARGKERGIESVFFAKINLLYMRFAITNGDQVERYKTSVSPMKIIIIDVDQVKSENEFKTYRFSVSCEDHDTLLQLKPYRLNSNRIDRSFLRRL